MARAGTVEVDIRANSAQFVREMKAVRRNTQQTARTMQNFARTAATAFAVIGGSQFIRGIVQSADQIEKFSQRIGVSGEGTLRF